MRNRPASCCPTILQPQGRFGTAQPISSAYHHVKSQSLQWLSSVLISWGLTDNRRLRPPTDRA